MRSALRSGSDRRRSRKRVRFELPEEQETVEKTYSHEDICAQRLMQGTRDMFLHDYGSSVQLVPEILDFKIKLKLGQFYAAVMEEVHAEEEKRRRVEAHQQAQDPDEPPHKKRRTSKKSKSKSKKKRKGATTPMQMLNEAEGTQVVPMLNAATEDGAIASRVDRIADTLTAEQEANARRREPTQQERALVLARRSQETTGDKRSIGSALGLRRRRETLRPTWHRPWRLYKVISGHMGSVNTIAIDPSNEWFATGADDRTIKIWDLAAGQLRLTLTGHVSGVQGLAVSKIHPYMFSCGLDKTVKCWDLEQNKVIRSYHGHLSGVYSLSLHPGLDVLLTGGRDASCRVWDIRTKAQALLLEGHKSTVWCIGTQSTQPQVVTGSADTTVRCWDLSTGKTRTILTHHKKQIRSLQIHPHEYSFATAGADNIKVWKCPEAEFLRNMTRPTQSITKALAVNGENVLVSGHDSGYLRFYDWTSGYMFQEETVMPQPGSLESEAGICCAQFDQTGIRLITGELDKSIKIWRPDSSATETSFPVDPNWRADMNNRRV